MINAHESGSSSRGRGLFSRDLTKTKILPGLCIWKNQYPRYSLAPWGGRGLKMTGAFKGLQNYVRSKEFSRIIEKLYYSL